MFRLYEKLPDSVQLGDTEYRLNLAFDVVLLAFEALQDTDMTEDDRLETFLRLLMVDELPSPDLWVSLFDNVLDLLKLDNDSPTRYDVNGDPIEMKAKAAKPDFEFDHDAQAIYASFWQAYGIDLFKEHGKLHWYSFQALLNGLPDDTVFSRIRTIRHTKLEDIKDKNQKREMRKLKRQVALPDEPDEEGADEYGG